MRFRCAFAIEDDLHRFAAAWLTAPTAYVSAVEHMDGAQVARVHIDGRFQVELCSVPAGYIIPDHIHPHADTIEVGVEGAVRLLVNGVDPFPRLPDALLSRFMRGRGVRINATDVHGGHAVSGAAAVFYSIQRWTGEPRSVLSDYRGQPLGPRHREALAA